ncbi:MAG: hypothetical protein LRY67_00960 [Gammaproteobacteria bacterium]|nr:hypothetical protein [Gammaproteobacteria bacterium]
MKKFEEEKNTLQEKQIHSFITNFIIDYCSQQESVELVVDSPYMVGDISVAVTVDEDAQKISIDNEMTKEISVPHIVMFEYAKDFSTVFQHKAEIEKLAHDFSQSRITPESETIDFIDFFEKRMKTNKVVNFIADPLGKNYCDEENKFINYIIRTELDRYEIEKEYFSSSSNNENKFETDNKTNRIKNDIAKYLHSMLTKDFSIQSFITMDKNEITDYLNNVDRELAGILDKESEHKESSFKPSRAINQVANIIDKIITIFLLKIVKENR